MMIKEETIFEGHYKNMTSWFMIYVGYIPVKLEEIVYYGIC